MASWKDFTGLSLIVGAYKQSVATSLLINELGPVSNGYTLENARTSESGWSFGGQQLDLSKRADGVLLLKDILTHQYGAGYWTPSLETALKKSNDPYSISNTVKVQIITTPIKYLNIKPYFGMLRHGKSRCTETVTGNIARAS